MDSSGFEGLSPTLIKALQEAFNIVSPTPIQAEAIPLLLESGTGDVVMQAQTGSGKTHLHTFRFWTWSYHLITLTSSSGDSSSFREDIGTIGLIIVPTRELAVQTQATLTKVLSRPSSLDRHNGSNRRETVVKVKRLVCVVDAKSSGTPRPFVGSFENWRDGNDPNYPGWLLMKLIDWLIWASKTLSRKSFNPLHGFASSPAWFWFPRLSLRSSKSNSPGESWRILVSSKQAPKKKFTGKKMKLKLLKPLKNQKLLKKRRIQRSSCNWSVYLHTPTKLRLQILVGLLRSFFPVAGSSQNTRVIVFFSCCDSVRFPFRFVQSGRRE